MFLKVRKREIQALARDFHAFFEATAPRAFQNLSETAAADRTARRRESPVIRRMVSSKLNLSAGQAIMILPRHDSVSWTGSNHTFFRFPQAGRSVWKGEQHIAETRIKAQTEAAAPFGTEICQGDDRFV